MVVRRFSTFLILLLFPLFLAGQAGSDQFKVERIDIDGNVAVSTRTLRSLIKLREPGLFRPARFNRRFLEIDALTLRAHYESLGYLDATVEPSFEILPFYQVAVRFQIREGERILLHEATIEGNAAFSDEEVIRILRLEVGRPVNPAAMRKGLDHLERKYRNLGRIFVTLDELLDRDEAGARYTLRIEEGSPARVDRIRLSGLVRADSSLVLRELLLRKDVTYSENLLERSQRRIFETGLFAMVNLVPVRSDRGEDKVDLMLELKEFRPRAFVSEGGFYPVQTALGAEPVSGLGQSFEWHHRNTWGTGRRFGVRATAQLPFDFAISGAVFRQRVPWVLQLESNLAGNWIAGIRLPTIVNLLYEDNPDPVDPSLHVRRYGVDWTYQYRMSEWTAFWGGLRWVLVESDDPARVSREDQENTVRFAFRTRRLDNPITPASGDAGSFEGSLIKGGNDGAMYYRWEAEYRWFLRGLWEEIWAFRVKAGRMEPIGLRSLDFDLGIPEYNLFYLGGSTSLRGWESRLFRSISPSDGNLRPEGGVVKGLLNLEVRIPLVWRFGANIFMDTGFLAKSEGELRQMVKPNAGRSGIGWSYGAELSFSTPLGPIRLYHAVSSEGGTGVTGLALLYAF